MTRSLVLEVQPLAGQLISKVIEDAVDLSKQLNLTVAITINNADFSISPRADHAKLVAEFKKRHRVNGKAIHIWG